MGDLLYLYQCNNVEDMFLLRVFIHIGNGQHQTRSCPERLSRLYSSGKGGGQEEVESDDSVSEEVAIAARYMGSI